MPISTPSPVVVEKPTINLLLYGSPGSGKTVLAATCKDHPELRDVLFVNFEGGLLSLGNPGPHVKQIVVRRVEEIEEIFWNLVNKKPGWETFRTVVLDSGSEMQTLSLEQISTDAFKLDVAKNKDKAKRTSMDDLFQADYGKDSSRLKRIFRWFRDAPFNVIITALSKKIFDKPNVPDAEPRLTDVLPAFTDKLGQHVMGYVDYVWYTYKDDDNKFFILTSSKGPYKAKTRGMKFSKAIGQIVESPSLPDLYDLLIKSENDSTPEEKSSTTTRSTNKEEKR